MENNKNVKAAIYIRVSTQEQVENYSIASQKERLEAYCTAKGWEIYKEFIDPGYSGSNMDRPGLQQMLNEINQIDAVVVYKLDRLSRSQKDTLTLIEEHFLSNKVDFVSITETLDTSTPFGKAAIGILSVFAQFERELITERMNMGKIKRIESGLRINSGNYNPSGYERTDDGLKIIPEEAEHIQKVYNLYEKYLSVTKIQAELKKQGYPVWRWRRYNDILKNILYTGSFNYAGKVYEGQHDAIIDPEQFQRIQILRSKNRGNNAYRGKKALLTGFIKCGECGEMYNNVMAYDVVKGEKVSYRYLTCRARRFPSEYPKKCMNKIWRSDVVEEHLINELKTIAFKKGLSKVERIEVDFNKHLKQISNKMERLINLYTEDRIDSDLLDARLDQLDREKKDVLQSKYEYENTETDEYSREDLENYTLQLQAAPFEERQAIVNKLVESITFYGPEFEIAWRV